MKSILIDIAVLFLLFLVTSCGFLEEKNTTKKIIFVGDLLLDRGVRDRIEHLGMDALFDVSIDSIFDRADVVIANLECPATKTLEPINKKYIFRAEPEWLEDIKRHGITHLTMANNHSMDQGREGLKSTNNNLKKYGLIPLGFGNNHKMACTEVLLTDRPRKVYVLSSSQVASENWTFLEEKPCICEASIDSVLKRVQVIRKKEPNSIVIIQLHWGAEHTDKPLLSQKQQAYSLIDAGADAIIGHHTHTIQSIERYKDRPIYYGIGNFIFDQANPINSEGLLVQIEIDKSSIYFKELIFDIYNSVPILR